MAKKKQVEQFDDSVSAPQGKGEIIEFDESLGEAESAGLAEVEGKEKGFIRLKRTWYAIQEVRVPLLCS